MEDEKQVTKVVEVDSINVVIMGKDFVLTKGQIREIIKQLKRYI